MPSKGEGRKKSIRKKLGELFILIVVVPLLFFALVELVVRVSGVDTEVVKSKKFKIATPVWAANDFNFFAAEGLYRDIVHNNLPAAAADWMQYFEEARYVRYKMKPDISVRAFNTVNRIELEKGIKVQLTSNGNGFRSRELPVKKGENVCRIAVLGDSTAFGWGVNQEERFSDVLEEKLNAAGGNYRYEVLNFGIPGYTTFHGRAVFDRYVLKYSPDMVILSFGANDGKKISATAKRIMQSKGVLEYIHRQFPGAGHTTGAAGAVLPHRLPGQDVGLSRGQKCGDAGRHAGVITQYPPHSGGHPLPQPGPLLPEPLRRRGTGKAAPPLRHQRHLPPQRPGPPPPRRNPIPHPFRFRLTKNIIPPSDSMA
jgi:hypothetical protein